MCFCTFSHFQKNIRIDHPHRQSKEELLELYYAHIIPRPQRTYRQNRQGRKMTRQQIVINKRKRPHDEISGNKTTQRFASFEKNDNKLSKILSHLPYLYCAVFIFCMILFVAKRWKIADLCALLTCQVFLETD